MPTTSPINNSGVVDNCKISSDCNARTRLSDAGIYVRSSGNCTDQDTSNCTSLANLPQSAITGLIETQKACSNYNANSGAGCITVTGGTETGHKSHGPNIPIVDIAYSDTAVKALTKSGLGQFICETGDVIVKCGPSADHIHVNFF